MENTLLRVETNVTINIIFLKFVQKNELKFRMSVMNALKNSEFKFKVNPWKTVSMHVLL